MTITVYLSIALVMAGEDALHCGLDGTRYNAAFSLLAALAWPIVAPVLIIGTVLHQRRKTRCN